MPNTFDLDLKMTENSKKLSQVKVGTRLIPALMAKDLAT